MNRIIKTLGVFGCLCLSALGLFAQSTEQLWLDVNPSYEYNSRLRIYGDLGYRVDFNKDQWNRFVFRPGIRKTYKDFYLTSGIGNFITIQRSDAGDNYYELRPFQGIGTNWPNYQHFKLQHYLRTEERLNWNLNQNDFNFVFRVRYKLNIVYAHNTWLTNHSDWWRLILGVEIFAATQDTSNNLDELSRLSLGLERSFNKTKKLRLETVWQKQTFFFSRNAPVNAFYLRIRYYPAWFQTQ